MITKKKRNKKGQTMSLPFTMIFSIILVAVVIFVGFYVINMFLDRTTQVELNSLPTEIQIEINDIRWSGASVADQEFEKNCPDEVDFICFVDFSMPARGDYSNKFNELEEFPARKEDSNFFYYPLRIAEKYDSFSDWRILCGSTDCVKVPDNTNPLCVQVINGKVKFRLVKELGQPYVFVRPLP